MQCVRACVCWLLVEACVRQMAWTLRDASLPSRTQRRLPAAGDRAAHHATPHRTCCGLSMLTLVSSNLSHVLPSGRM
jgi:hypothetical protein